MSFWRSRFLHRSRSWLMMCVCKTKGKNIVASRTLKSFFVQFEFPAAAFVQRLIFARDYRVSRCPGSTMMSLVGVFAFPIKRQVHK